MMMLLLLVALGSAVQLPVADTQGTMIGRRAEQVAVDPELEAATQAVASQLRCVVCQGLSIQDSPSELAQNMRAVVRSQLAEGKTPEEVKQFFVASYGEWILLAPEPHGFNLAVYLLPVAAVLGGALLLFIVIRRWARKAEDGPADDILQDEPELAAWDEAAR
jgi:cytochrome c-type biogenesis protein CcmH/NrfF